jgi:hypothetical protein
VDQRNDNDKGDAMKYIRFQSRPPTFVCFPDFVEHRPVADALAPVYGAPVSAGFVQSGECVGRSDGLNLDSRPEDTRLMRAVMGEGMP